ncbi:MAG: class I SAM-dependent methyltransferase [Propylenella sp.]
MAGEHALIFDHDRAVVTVSDDADGWRKVSVQPKHPISVQRSPCRTTYPDDLIRRILDVKGPEYLCDEIARDQDPAYTEANIDIGLFSYLKPADFAGKTLLDFGCGCGSSTMILARKLPKTAIVGTDMLAESLSVARARARHYGRRDITFHASPSGSELPPALEPMDFIVMNAVFEHFLPEERRRVIHLLWRKLKKGGTLFIQETPNRWSPIEFHSTGLPLLNYTWDGLAHRAATRLSRRIEDNSTWEELLRGGIRGATVREILRCIPGKARRLEPVLLGGKDQADLWYAMSNRRHGRSARRMAVRMAFKLAGRISSLDFTPELALAIQKVSD